jgi:nondiscriminating glutamyl-tRNA synthetase
VLVSINLSGCKNGPDKRKLEEERKALILSKRMPRYMGKCRNLTEEEKKSGKMKTRNLHSFRFKVSPQAIGFEDLIRGAMKFEAEAIGDFIIVCSNGMPAYNYLGLLGSSFTDGGEVLSREEMIAGFFIGARLEKRRDI